MPKISVIVPVYNVEKYVARCIESMLAQTFSDFELVLVDDGSTDASGTVCDTYAAKDERIFVIHKENGGMSDARNAGLDHLFSVGDSEWISFVDSDDWVDKAFLETLYNTAVSEQADAAMCGHQDVYDDSWNSFRFEDVKTIKETIDGKEALNRLSFSWDYSVVCNKLYQKSLFEDLRFPKGKFHEDEYLLPYVYHRCGKIAVTDAALYFYFHRAGSVMSTAVYPKRFDFLEGLEDRILFYEKNQYEELRAKCISYYFYRIVRDIKMLHSGPQKNREYHKRLIRIMERFGSQYGKELDYSVYQIYCDSVDREHMDIGERIRLLRYYCKMVGIKGLINKLCKRP